MARRSSWMDDDYDPSEKFWARHPVWTGVLVLVAFAILGAVVWGIGVATSDTYGRGEATKQINSATNRVQKQEMFEDLIAHVATYDDQIDTQAQALAAAKADGTDPDEVARLSTVLTGLKNQCASTQNQYGAEARKQSAERFRSSDLPVAITADDPNLPGPWQDYDCQENTGS